MVERPILFSAPMVRAILDGQKTQTRRVVKPQPPEFVRHSVAPQELRGDPKKHPAPYFDAYNGGPHWCWWDEYDRQGAGWIKCPYGKPGDRLWVREAHYLTDDGESEYAVYAADEASAEKHLRECTDMAQRHPVGDGWLKRHTKLRPSIHMPRWASRILLEIVSIRVERLNDCTASDARAEGIFQEHHVWRDCEHPLADVAYRGWPGAPVRFSDSVDAYRDLWEHINGEGSWSANPWVWVVEFKRVQA